MAVRRKCSTFYEFELLLCFNSVVYMYVIIVKELLGYSGLYLSWSQVFMHNDVVQTVSCGERQPT